MADAFLQRRTSGAKAEQWRAAAARLLCVVGGEEKRNGTASAFGRRAGWLQTRLRRQEAHGRGQREQESGDEWRTRGVVFLKLDHCSFDSVPNSDD